MKIIGATDNITIHDQFVIHFQRFTPAWGTSPPPPPRDSMVRGLHATFSLEPALRASSN